MNKDSVDAVTAALRAAKAYGKNPDSPDTLATLASALASDGLVIPYLKPGGLFRDKWNLPVDPTVWPSVVAGWIREDGLDAAQVLFIDLIPEAQDHVYATAIKAARQIDLVTRAGRAHLPRGDQFPDALVALLEWCAAGLPRHQDLFLQASQRFRHLERLPIDIRNTDPELDFLPLTCLLGSSEGLLVVLDMVFGDRSSSEERSS